MMVVMVMTVIVMVVVVVAMAAMIVIMMVIMVMVVVVMVMVVLMMIVITMVMVMMVDGIGCLNQPCRLVGSRAICCIFCTLQNLFCFHWFFSAKFISVSGCKICRVLDQALSSEQEESYARDVISAS